jgi:hypothetical protein
VDLEMVLFIIGATLFITGVCAFLWRLDKIAGKMIQEIQKAADDNAGRQ